MAKARNLPTLDSLNHRNIARSHESGVIEREKARRRLDRMAKAKQRTKQVQEELKMKTHTVQHTEAKKRTRPGVVMDPLLRSPLIEHIYRVGEKEASEDIENLEPSRSGSSSARDAIRDLLQKPEHRWAARSIRMWTRLLACWSRGRRPHELRREGIDLNLNGEVVTVLGETVREDLQAQTTVVQPEPEPAAPEQTALMSYQVNAEGLPVMVMDGVTIRVAGTPERPLFCAEDVGKAIGYSDPAGAVAKHVDPEDVEPIRRDGGNGGKPADYINESGIYSLMLRSKLPKAKPFGRWVTGEVLPSIRKTGAYSTDAANGTRSIATTDKVLMVEVMTEAFAQVVTRVLPMIQQAQQPGIQRQEFDVNGFEVPSGELPKTNKRAGINGLIESYVAANPDVSREECHSLLHKRFQSAYGIRPPKDCPNKLDWYEKNGHIDALYALAYAMFARRNGG